MPGRVGVEGGTCGKAQDAQLEAQGCSPCHAAVLGLAHVPWEIRCGLVAELHYVVHGLGERVAGIFHLLVGTHGVIQDGNAAHVTQHVGIGDCHAHLCLGLLLCKGCRVCIGDAVCVLEEQPCIADDMVVILASEAVGHAGSAAGEVGIEGAGVIEVVGAVAVGVLVGDIVVGYGLEEVGAHLGVEVGHETVRQVVICSCKHLVCILEGGKQGIGRSTGSLGGL